MDILKSVIVIVALMMVIFYFNWWRALHKTSRERQEIIAWAFYHKNWRELIAMYEAVPWEQHHKSNIFFKNPFLLYNPELFSTFHLLKHGVNEYTDRVTQGIEVICPYIPKSV